MPITLKRFTIVKLQAIGDVTITAQCLSALAPSLTHWQITWVIDSKLKDYAHSLLDTRLHVEFVSLNSKLLFTKRSLTSLVQGALKFIQAIKHGKPSNIVVLHRDWRYRFLARMTTKAVVSALSYEKISEYDAIMGLLCQCTGIRPPPAPQHASRVSHSSQSTVKIAVLIGGGRNVKTDYPEKRWPHFLRLVELLTRDKRYELTLLGAKEDALEADAILNALTIQDAAIKNLVGCLPLSDLPQFLSTQDGFVGIDSGPGHLAAHVFRSGEQKLFSLFGPTDPRIWAPTSSHGASVHVLTKKLRCSPCYKNDGHFQTCIHKEGTSRFRECMSLLTADDVYESISISFSMTS